MTLKTAILTFSERRTEMLVLIAAGIFYAAAAFLPWDWPSIDGYPAIERFLDPGFLTDDFYTNTTTDYNVDTLLAVGLSAAQEASGVHYDFILAALNLVRLLVWPFVLFCFFRALAIERRVALVGAVLGAGSLYRLPDLFAWGWLWGDPSTAMFSVLFVVAGWTYFLDRRAAMAMIMFSFALFVHPLIAVLGGVFVAIIFFADFNREEKISTLKSPSAWLAGLVFVALFFLQYLLLGVAPDERLPTGEYTRILAWVRHPTDFIPSLFPMRDWAAGLSSAIAAIIIVVKMKDEFRRWKAVAAGLASYFALCLCGYLFVEVHPVRFFVELIPFRYVIVGAPLMLFVYALFAYAEARDGRFASFALIVALFFSATPAAHFGAASLVPAMGLASWVALRLLAGAYPLGFIDRAFAQPDLRTALVALSLVLLALAAPAAYLRRHEFVIPRAANQHPLYAWAISGTPADAVFLVDQYGAPRFSRAIDPQRMRLVGRRAVVASKDFPFLDRDIRPWNERWQTALGGGAPHFVSSASGEALAAIAAKFPFDYVVRDTLLEDPRFARVMEFEPAKGVGEIYVYKFTR